MLITSVHMREQGVGSVSVQGTKQRSRGSNSGSTSHQLLVTDN
ncbi:hypothetical protein [Chroococcidiopsis sp [FACHB-1243]]|nr:hypothetical protein [Chroococcidiopsis sp. [FACHB-1243]]